MVSIWKQPQKRQESEKHIHLSKQTEIVNWLRLKRNEKL